MRFAKPLVSVVSASLLLAACAPSQPMLDNANAACAAGNQQACQAVPGLQARVTGEQNANVATGVAVGAAALAVAGLVILGTHPWRSPPPRVWVPPRPGF